MTSTQSKIILILLAFAVHMLSIPLMGTDPLKGDAKQFNDEADCILDGKGWINTEGEGQATTTYPTQVVFLLACKIIFGRDAYVFPVIFQHLFVLSTAFLVYRIALILRFTPGVAILAGALVAFFPNMIFIANILISHTIGMFLAVLGIYLILLKPSHWSYNLLIGLVWGAATLSRFTFQFYVPLWITFTVVVELIRTRHLARATIVRSLLVLVGFMLILLPWNIRVHNLEGGGSGYTAVWRICYSFNRAPDLRGDGADSFQLSLLADSTMTRSELEARYKEKVLENFKEHPEWFVNNWLTNLSYLLVNFSTFEKPHRSVYIGIYYSILIGFGLIGLIAISQSQHIALLPVYLLVVVVFGIHVPIYGYLANSFPVWACFSPVVAHGIILSVRAANLQRQHLNSERTTGRNGH